MTFDQLARSIPAWDTLTPWQQDQVSFMDSTVPDSAWFVGKNVDGVVEYLIATPHSVISLILSGKRLGEMHTSELADNGEGWTTGFEA